MDTDAEVPLGVPWKSHGCEEVTLNLRQEREERELSKALGSGKFRADRCAGLGSEGHTGVTTDEAGTLEDAGRSQLCESPWICTSSTPQAVGSHRGEEQGEICILDASHWCP